MKEKKIFENNFYVVTNERFMMKESNQQYSIEDIDLIEENNGSKLTSIVIGGLSLYLTWFAIKDDLSFWFYLFNAALFLYAIGKFVGTDSFKIIYGSSVIIGRSLSEDHQSLISAIKNAQEEQYANKRQALQNEIDEIPKS